MRAKAETFHGDAVRIASASARLAVVRHIVVLIVVLFAAMAATAQQFGCHWMSCAEPDDTSYVWFRRTVVAPIGSSARQRPREALLHVATTGRLIVYVNSRAVSPASYLPERAEGDTSVVGTTIDVRRFMRPDTNTIAIAYCPSARTRRQLSATLYGIRADGSRFAVGGGDGWLCRRADRWRTADGGEAADAVSYPYLWTSATQPLALWLAAEDGESEASAGEPMTDMGLDPSDIFPLSAVTCMPVAANGPVVKCVSQPMLMEQTADSLVYGLPPGFRGFVRVTLRGCRRGGHIRIGNVRYTCSGSDDEQAFSCFAPYEGDRLAVSGDRHFRSSQVQNVEAMELSELRQSRVK